MSTHNVTLIPGDGIGPELSNATCVRVVEATGVSINWDVQEAGGRRGRHREVRHTAAGTGPRLHPQEQGRHQGAY